MRGRHLLLTGLRIQGALRDLERGRRWPGCGDPGDLPLKGRTPVSDLRWDTARQHSCHSSHSSITPLFTLVEPKTGAVSPTFWSGPTLLPITGLTLLSLTNLLFLSFVVFHSFVVVLLTCFYMKIPISGLSVCPYPEKRNHHSFVNISLTVVNDRWMEMFSRILQHGTT